ncbi:MAG: STAS domain-containing protein [Candidatus Wallbacteria bacterium]|nr:STAS domain-containing protein [Candidatus Wallbacteria bacterium]
MKISKESISGVTILKIAGEFDFHSEIEFNTIISGLTFEELKKVMLSMAEIDWIDSSALNSIIDLYWKVKKINGSLLLAGVNPRIAKLLAITKICTLLETIPTEEDALKKLQNM